MIDAHCHLYDLDNIEAEVRRFREVGGEAMICCGADLESSKKSIAIAQKYPEVYATVGNHPESGNKFDVELNSLVNSHKVVAVGECGLDSDSEKEIELFKFNIDLAKEAGLPLVVHCRNLFERVFEVLDYDKVQMHCFTGNEEEMRECVRRGWYISFGGILTFKKSDYLREVARLVPEEKLLVETDSPYLAPEPVRGTKNVPANVKYVLSCLEEIRGKSMERITSENARRLFKI